VKSSCEEVAAELEVSPEIRVGPGSRDEKEEQAEKYGAEKDEGSCFEDGRRRFAQLGTPGER
jgi:hypothetical protein